MLTKGERNAIYGAISESTFSHTEFELADGSRSFTLRHPGSGSYFRANSGAGLLEGRSKVGDEREKYLRLGRSAVPDAITSWLGQVKEYEETPDLWAELKDDQEVLKAASEDPENASFDSADKLAIRAALKQIEDAEPSWVRRRLVL